MNAVSADPGHASALSEIFGIGDAVWFLEKAARELDRYLASNSALERTDSLFNFCSTLISLEDWSYQGAPADAGAWRAEHRNACPEHAIVALISLIAKHRDVSDGRFRELRLESTDEFSIWTEAATPEIVLEWVRSELPAAKILGVRTLVEDDQISGYIISVRVEGLKVNGTTVPTPRLLTTALSYWREVLAAR